MKERDIKLLEETIERTNPTMEGWCSVDKAKEIARQILQNNAMNFVEIGVYGGKSLIPAALTFQALGRGVAYGIDPWTVEACLEGSNDPQNDHWWSKVVPLEEIYKGFVKKVFELGLTKHANWIRFKSTESAGLFPVHSIDILHIDGNHSKETSTEDVLVWMPKVKMNGIIIMDDTAWTSLHNAVQLVREKCDLVKTEDNWIVCRKVRA